MSSKGLAGSPPWLAAGNLIYESGNLAASGLIQSQIQGAIVSQKLLGCFDDNTNNTIRPCTSFVLVCHTWKNISNTICHYTCSSLICNRFHKSSEDQPRGFLSFGNLLECFLLCQYFASIISPYVFLKSAKTTTMSMIDSCQPFVFRNIISFSSYT